MRMNAEKQNKEAVIRVENLSAHFGKRIILREVSFQAFSNEITVILGRSGCGKTTLLKHLIGLYPVRQGRVEVMNFSLAGIEEDDYHQFALRIGVLFQNGALLNSLTVAENVAIPLEQNTHLPASIIDYLVRLKLHLVELENAADLYPTQLSGGMRKRAALARAIALDPPILFADEPSAGLDPVTLSALDELFLRLKHGLGMTILLVTHEVPSILRLADRVVFLDEGRVLYAGPLTGALESDIEPIKEFFRRELSLRSLKGSSSLQSRK